MLVATASQGSGAVLVADACVDQLSPVVAQFGSRQSLREEVVLSEVAPGDEFDGDVMVWSVDDLDLVACADISLLQDAKVGAWAVGVREA
jgi:hypothetical protein